MSDARYTDEFAKKLIESSTTSWNLDQDFIVTTADKLRLCLIRYEGALSSKGGWAGPLGLFVTLLLVFPTAEFRQFILPADTWRAIFVLGAAAAGVWTSVMIVRACRTDATLDTVISDIQKTDPRNKSQKSR